MLGAGTDPTHIPGLGAPGADEPEAAAEEAPPGAAVAEKADVEETEAEAPVAEDDERTEGDGAEASGSDDRPEGPAFEVSDRRGSITADGTGVTFRLDDTEARFGWDEIGAVEIGSSRVGRRFAVTVSTLGHRRFEADVQAPARGVLGEWTAELDAVLDAWFEGGPPAD